MSEQVVPPSVVQRIIIKFLSIEGPIRGMKPFLKPQVCEWDKRFSAGRERMENESHDRRPRITEECEHLCSTVNVAIGTLEETARSVGISNGSVHSIIHDKFDFGKVSTRWVTQLLIPNQKSVRFEVCQRFLARYEDVGKGLLNRIVTCDETWV
ncbi:hypothetical protein NQ318_022111 [Aromia moschata]|uniref:Transposase n=1 Tax=Aromia moschata TaxID=1265417 RepID=A0AAV8Z6L3_9CUCU|nr:hypothetical protein NQ318_022111 [Aromia moschata]